MFMILVVLLSQQDRVLKVVLYYQLAYLMVAIKFVHTLSVSTREHYSK